MKRALILLSLFFFSVQSFAGAKHSTLTIPTTDAGHVSVQGRYDLDPSLDKAWIHTITNIDLKKHTVTLDDGSTWTANYYYRSVLKDWQVGDKMTVSFFEDAYIISFKLKNYTKKTHVWAKENELPKLSASGFLYITHVDQHAMSIDLSNGTHVSSDQLQTFKHWHEGDVVLTLNRHGSETPYALWNYYKDRHNLVYDLTVS